MSEVWVLSEGVQVEGMSIVGAFSSWNMAISCAAGLIVRSRPTNYELQIDRLQMDNALSTWPPYHLKHPWEAWT